MPAKKVIQQTKNSLRSLKRTAKNLHKRWKNRANLEADTLWVSIGENCLADDILRRHNRKSYSTVFSSGRSNIEYVLQMEKDNYINLLKEEHLKIFSESEGAVVRSTYYKECQGTYSPRHMLGFEFSHHNPLDVGEDKRAFGRRISRQLAFRGEKNFIFLYHHRMTEHSDLAQLKSHLNELLAIYNAKGRQCQVALFYQSIIGRSDEKSLSVTSHDTGLLEFVCHTHDVWGGDDQDIFWARNDDALFTEMFSIVDSSKAA